jgi:hypothetical protein
MHAGTVQERGVLWAGFMFHHNLLGCLLIILHSSGS